MLLVGVDILGSRPITVRREFGEIYSVGIVPAGQNPFEKTTGRSLSVGFYYR